MKHILSKQIIAKLKENIKSYAIDRKGNIQIWIKFQKKEEIFYIANTIKEFNGRCVSIIAYEEDNHHFLIYYFDIKGILISVETRLIENEIYSITPVLKSADLQEREIRDIYKIRFVNHPNPKKLFLNDGKEITADNYLPLSTVMKGLTGNMYHKKEQNAL